MAVHPIGPLRDIDTLDAATNRNCATGSRLPPPRWFQPRAISAQLSHARISAPSSTESYDIIYITFCDANQERHRNATPRSCAQIESYLLRSGRKRRSLPGPLVTDRHGPIFEDARPQPFLDQADDARVADPMVQEAYQPILANFVEERSNVGVQNVAHLLAVDADY